MILSNIVEVWFQPFNLTYMHAHLCYNSTLLNQYHFQRRGIEIEQTPQSNECLRVVIILD